MEKKIPHSYHLQFLIGYRLDLIIKKIISTIANTKEFPKKVLLTFLIE